MRLKEGITITDLQRVEFLREIERLNALICAGEFTVDEQMSVTRTGAERQEFLDDEAIFDVSISR